MYSTFFPSPLWGGLGWGSLRCKGCWLFQPKFDMHLTSSETETLSPR